MKWIFFLIGCGLYLEATAVDSTGFRFFKELSSSSESDSIGRFELDAEIFAGTRDRFHDLRIVKVDGGSETEIPYLVSRVDRYAPPQSATPIQTKILSFDENPDGSVEFEIRFAERETEKSCATIELRTPLRDFEKNVDVDGSEDGKTWQPLVAGVLIFDRERYLDFRRTSVALPDNTARFFRIRIAEASDEQRSVVREISRTVGEQTGTSVTETATVATRAFRIDDLKFLTAEIEESESDSERSYSNNIVDRKENPETHSTEILLDTYRSPVKSLTIKTEDKNFRREVCVQVLRTSGVDGWKTIKRSRIHRYQIGDFHDEDLSIEFETTRSESFRILIENGDSPALAIDEIVATGDRFEALFLAEPNAEWRVYYGSNRRNPAAPRYDTAALNIAKSRGIAAIKYEISEEQKNPQFDKKATGLKWTEQRWLLWLVVAVVVAALAWVLIRTGTNIEAME